MELQSLYSHLILQRNDLKLCETKMDMFRYTPLLTGLNMRFDQSTETCSIPRLIRVGCCMFYSSKIHNIGCILLKRTFLKTPQTLKKRFAVVNLQTNQLAIVIKIVQN